MFVGKYDGALATAKRGEAIALTSNDPIAVARMRVLLSMSCQYLGRFADSRSYIEAALRHPGLDGDILSGLTLEYPKHAQITLARVLWLQGYPDQAAQMVRRAISDVIVTNHPVMFCRALAWAFDVFFWNGDTEDCEEHVDRLIVEARRHNLAILQMVGEAMKGITLLARNETGIGLAMLKGSIEKLQSQCFGAVSGLSMVLAEALAATGHGDEALDTIDQAIAQARHCNFMMEMPDMLRARAEALMHKSNPDLSQAEMSFVQLSLVFLAVGAYSMAINGAFGGASRSGAASASFVAGVAFAALSPSWISGVVLLAVSVLAVAAFAGAAWTISTMVFTASSEASLPPACPPMPSHTTASSPRRVSTCEAASSLTCFSGSRPGSVRNAISTAGLFG